MHIYPEYSTLAEETDFAFIYIAAEAGARLAMTTYPETDAAPAASATEHLCRSSTAVDGVAETMTRLTLSVVVRVRKVRTLRYAFRAISHIFACVASFPALNHTPVIITVICALLTEIKFTQIYYLMSQKIVKIPFRLVFRKK